MPHIWYYDGGLYVSKVDGDYMGVEKIALDGSTRTDSCTPLHKVSGAWSSQPSLLGNKAFPALLRYLTW